MSKQRIRLTESQLNRIVKTTVDKIVNEGTAFSHENNEWGNDYFTDALSLINGMGNALRAMEDKGNSNDYRSVEYLFRQFEDRYNQLGQIIPIIKKYIKEPQHQF